MFLHADTRLGAGWIDALRRLDEQPRIVGGSFRFALDSPARWARWIEWGVRIRVRLFDLAYGDQALFVRRTVFEELGGYRELPLMEDVDFIRRLRRRGRLEHVDVPALTSARRWERDGWFRRTVDNVLLVAAVSCRAPARTPGTPLPSRTASADEEAGGIAIMARAPSSEGKSRLIRDLGTRDGAEPAAGAAAGYLRIGFCARGRESGALYPAGSRGRNSSGDAVSGRVPATARLDARRTDA